MRRRSLRVPAQTATTVTIPVSSLATGAQSANAFSGWTSPATTVFTSSGYGGSAGTKYISTADHTYFIAKTVGASRDQELSTFGERCNIYLRWTDAGKCFVFSSSTETNSYSVGVFSNVIEGTSNPAGSGPGGGVFITNSFITPLPAITSVPGWSPTNTAGKAWTFGVEGFDIYLKYGGVEFWRSKQFYHLESGRMALGAHPSETNYGFRDVTATHKVSAGLYSDLTSKVFDLRDFGMKSLKTTGSMTANSTSLVVASAAGFSVGDRICVAVGGEAGGGVPGERGVGGQWPTLLYADAAARNADTSQPTNKCCGLLSDGTAHKWTGSSWVPYYGNLAKYLQRIVPKGLVATITGISGNTLTLNTPSVAATNNAEVRFDSGSLMSQSLTATNNGLRQQLACTISIPPGKDWCFAGVSPAFDQIPGIKIVGAGKNNTTIVSPKGIMPTGFYITQSSGFIVSDIEFIGNSRSDKGYMFQFNATTDDWTGISEFIRGSTSDGALITRIRGINHGLSCTGLNYCSNSLIKDIEVIHETGHKQYFQWSVGFADSNNCTVEDITYDCPNLLKGLETFRSTNGTLRRATGRNAVFSSNASSGALFEDCNIYYEPGTGIAGVDAAFPGADNPSPFEPLVNLNSNIDNTSGSQTGTGVTVRNCNFDVRGRVFGTGFGITVIGVSGSVDNVLIQGKYPAKPVTQPSGFFNIPNLGGDPAMAMRCDTPTKIVTLDGVRIITASATAPVGGFLGGTLHTGQTIKNSVLDLYPATINGTLQNNITNATYEAL